MTISSTKIGTCPACGKGLYVVTAPIAGRRPHICTPILSLAQQVRKSNDIARETARLSSYRHGVQSYLRSL